MLKSIIGIIGFGNMGTAIADGLLAKKIVPATHIIVSNETMPISEKDILCTTDNKEVVQKANVLILAVKPQVMDDVLNEIKSEVSKEQLIISIAAGLTLKNFQDAFDDRQPIIRAMPNLCAKISESMTAWTKTDAVSKEQEMMAKEIFQAFGKEVYLSDESMINDFTVIAGSGPAYVFYLAELMQKAAADFGFHPDAVREMVYQTLKGSVDTLLKSADTPEALRQQVTSKKGVTEAVLAVFEEGKIREVFGKGLAAGKERAEELAH